MRVFLLLFSFIAYSQSQKVLTLITDFNHKKIPLEVKEDESGNLIELIVDGESFEKDKLFRKLKRKLVITRALKIPAVFAKSYDFNKYSGGRIHFFFLSSIFKRVYKRRTFELTKEKGKWVVYEADDLNDPIKTIYVKTRKFFGLPVGVRRLKYSYTSFLLEN